MQKLVVTSTFLIKSEEQAGYIQKLLSDLADVFDVENSETTFTLDEYIRKVDPEPQCRIEGCTNRPMHHFGICEPCDFKESFLLASESFGYSPRP